MKNLSIIKFLQALNPQEMDLFDKYVHSPLFNNPESKTTELLEILKEHYPNFPAEEIKKQKVFKLLFPGEKYVEKRVYDVGIYLYHMLLNFFALQQLLKDRNYWEPISFIPAFYNRNLNNYLPGFIEDAEKKMLQMEQRDEFYYQYRYELSKTKCNVVLSKDSRSATVPIEEASEDLNQFFLASKLRLALSLANRNLVLNTDKQDKRIAEARQVYQQFRNQESHVADLYFATLEMLLSMEDDRYFQKYRKLMGAYGKRLAKDTQYELYLYGVNYSSLQIKNAKPEFYEEVFELYAEMLAQDLFFEYSVNNHINFKNLNNICIKLGKLTWAKSFVRKYGKFLQPRYQETVVSYCLAGLCFAERNYKQAWQELEKVEFIDPYYRLSYDVLILKIHYETEEYPSLFSRCAASLTYLKRDTYLSVNNKEAYTNLVKFVKRLGNFKLKQKKNLDWIRRDFETIRLMVDREWIKEKIEELSSSNS